MGGLFRILNLGLAVDALQNTNNAKQAKERKPFLNRVVSFVAKTLILIELVKYIFTGILFSGFLLVNNIKALFGLTEKSQVYIESAESVNRLYDYAGQFIESIEFDVRLDENSNDNILEDTNNIQSNILNEDVIKVKEDAVSVLKRLKLINVIDGNNVELNFSVEDFKSQNLSLRKTSDINAISQIYAFELAVREFNPNAIDDYYRGIKCRYEDRYYESKEDFINSIGCVNEFDYSNMVEEYIISKNGDINISSTNNTRLSNQGNNPNLAKPIANNFKHNGEDRGQSLARIIKDQKQAQSDNMKSRALGTYQARKLHR